MNINDIINLIREKLSIINSIDTSESVTIEGQYVKRLGIKNKHTSNLVMLWFYDDHVVFCIRHAGPVHDEIAKKTSETIIEYENLDIDELYLMVTKAIKV